MVAVFVTFAGVAPRADAAPQSAPPKAFIVADADTGTVLLAGNQHEALPPASTAKLMTALTAVERLAPDALIGVTQRAANQPASRISMQVGQQWPLVDTLAAVMMVSANDAAYALAEATSGSVESFAGTEAATAKRYGMKDSTFSDPAGLDDDMSFGGGPRMSAFDIAISARNTLAVPELALFAALKERAFVDPAGAQRNLVNHNRMLVGNSNAYDGATGLKTGFTNLAGRTFVGSATRNGRTLIVVVLGTYDIYGWAAQLLDEGFATAPDADGTGERLPAIEVNPYAQRVGDRDGFLAHTGQGDAGADGLAGATTSSTTPAEAAAVWGTTAPPRTAAASGDTDDAGAGSDREASARRTQAPSDGGDSWFTTRNVVVIVLLTLIALVVLRRRAVKRRRARRLAQRRAMKAAMRRGSLPVVDGKYRPGTRIGPPLESHVRVHRVQRPPGRAG